MSTYYYFACKKHKVRGGFLSRQAWGTGNFDIIETFKFLGLHKDCHPYLISEHEEDDLEEQHPKEFVEQTREIMPYSNDWSLVNESEWKDVETKWEKNFLERKLKFRPSPEPNMNTKDKIQNSLDELERQSKFAKDYRELMEALIQVSKVHRIYNLVFDEVKLPQQWFEKYPNLLKDLEENKLKDRLLGFNLKLPPW